MDRNLLRPIIKDASVVGRRIPQDFWRAGGISRTLQQSRCPWPTRWARSRAPIPLPLVKNSATQLYLDDLGRPYGDGAFRRRAGTFPRPSRRRSDPLAARDPEDPWYD